MRLLNSQQASFEQELTELLAFETVNDPALLATVDDIIAQVRQGGDEVVLKLTQQFDNHPAKTFAELEISQEKLKQAFDGLNPTIKQALELAAQRVTSFHERQRQESWTYQDALGNTLGQQVTPLDKVGIYVPGGLASYPSSVLMNALPAKVAGVGQIIMVVPAPHGELNPLVLAAAYLAGVDKVFTIGGAQAVAALAYGTNTIPQVDKITGPGNKYVAAAKRAVFGQVGIDMIAGPSEVLVYAEGVANDKADWLAMDLLSQAEHDTVAQAIFVTPSKPLLKKVAQEIEKALADLPKADIAKAAIANRGALILVKDRAEGIEVINRIAPEHLELSVDDPEAMVKDIRHAGAIFMGRYTPEAIGDYCAGPNHVLPTSGTARFSSPLGVYDFLTDPIDTVSRIDNVTVMLLGALTFVTATIGINIVANFVAPAFDFSNVSPRNISFRMGGFIAAIGAVFITPWNLFNSPQVIHYTLDILAAFIGPLFGILLTDFYLIRKQVIKVEDLYTTDPNGAYWYSNGWNPKAVMALIPAVIVGVAITLMGLKGLADFNWFIGCGLGAVMYYILMPKTNNH